MDKIILSFVFLTITFLGCFSKKESQIALMGGAQQVEHFPFENYNGIEVYSYNRSQKFKDSILIELEQLNFSPPEEDSTSRQQRLFLMDSLRNLKEYGEGTIINFSGGKKIFARTSMKTKTLTKSEVAKLRNIFRTPKALDDESLCTPKYRDAIVFKNDSQIIGWIDICFDCHQINSFPESMFLFSIEQWKELKDFLKGLGHKIKNKAD